MALIVQKFGGSSLATIAKIRQMAKKISETKNNGTQIVVVVSAMSGDTDKLLNMSKTVMPDPPSREQDALIATGEQVSAALMAMTLTSIGHKAQSYMGMQLPLFTDKHHTNARIEDLQTELLKKVLKEDIIPVVTGFQGVSNSGDITTLGRGGSDTTAVALAAALQADCCETYTDVDGVYTADPSICPQAKHLKIVSYQEMLEMAALGAKVLHTRSVELAKKFQVPLAVKSSFSNEKCTWIVNEEVLMENSVIKGVTLERNVSIISLLHVPDEPGIAYKILSPLADAAINVDMIIQNASIEGYTDFTFTVPKTELTRAHKLISEVARDIGNVEILTDDSIVKVSAVGIGIRTNPGVAARMFKSLSAENINIHMISTSEYRISCAIDEKYGELAVRAIHKAFNLDKIGVIEGKKDE